MSSKVTIKDVARCAGVSVGTVSKVINLGLNESPRHQRVLEAIKTLRYRPNIYARAVRSSHSNCLCFLMEIGRAHV